MAQSRTLAFSFLLTIFACILFAFPVISLHQLSAMRGLTLFSLAIALSAVGLYRLSPIYPSDIEQTFHDRLQNLFAIGLFKLLLTAESYGLIDDTASLFREITAWVLPNSNTFENVQHLDVVVEPTKIADVPVIIFRPTNGDKVPKKPPGALVYFHGGAFFFLTAWTHYRWTKKLAVDAGVVVISVDYRLAPEHPFPAGVEDCLAVTKAVFDKADSFGIDPTRILVGGDSAGGNLASVVAIELGSDAKYQLKGQVLLSPSLQGIEVLPANKAYAWYIPFPRGFTVAKYAGLHYSNEVHHAVLTGRHLLPGDKEPYARYVNMSNLSDDLKSLLHGLEPINNLHVPESSPEPTPSVKKILGPLRELLLNERAWPLLTKDDNKLRRVCPALMSIAEYDPLRDEALLYYDRLRSLGVKVTLSYMKRTTHCGPSSAIMTNHPLSENARTKYIPDIINFIKEQVGGERRTVTFWCSLDFVKSSDNKKLFHAWQ